MNLLLFSNSTNAGSGYLDHARGAIEELVAGRRLVFLPFALDDWGSYTDQVRTALPGIEVVGAHETGLAEEAILAAEVVFVGGGNTFRLLQALEHLDLVEALSERVKLGSCDYIGASAGTNVACPTIRTTNDMPIVEVGSFRALDLVPFQINPHFTDAHPQSLMAETRRDRLEQFHERSSTPVLGLREGSWLHVRGEDMLISGDGGGVMFTRGTATELAVGGSLDRWTYKAEFDDQLPQLLNGHRLRNSSSRSN